MLKIGRLNARTLMGPVKFPAGPIGLMKNVDEIFTAFFVSGIFHVFQNCSLNPNGSIQAKILNQKTLSTFKSMKEIFLVIGLLVKWTLLPEVAMVLLEELSLDILTILKIRLGQQIVLFAV